MINRRTAMLAIGATVAQPLFTREARAAESIRVTEQPIDASFEVSYAVAQGFTTQAGLDVEVVLNSNGAASLAAVIGGAAEIGNTNTFSLFAARERGIPLVALAPGSVYNTKTPSTFLMVVKDSPIQTARDLMGKTIAVDGLRNITQLGPMAWVDKNGGDSRMLKFVEMPFADMGLALASHRVDAAVIAEPFASRATESRILVSAYDGIAPSFAIGVWAATPAWVAAHQEAAKAFARMIYRTAVWANAHHDDTADTLVKVAKIDAARIKTLVRATFAERYTPALLQPVIDNALKYGIITKSMRPDDVLASGMPRSV